MGSECRTRIAIIVAAGSGTRFGAKKQFLEVNGKPLYYYSVKAFLPLVDRVILVVPKEDIDIIEPYGAELASGGENRYDSVYSGLKLCSKDSLIAVHDAARPGITKEVINVTFDTANEYGGSVPVIPVTDTIRTTNGELLDRSKLRAMQTPQTFKGEILIEAYEKLMKLTENERKELHITDDVQVAELMKGLKSRFCEGSDKNFKVTTREDMEKLDI